jgi:CRISPR-associated protein Cas1
MVGRIVELMTDGSHVSVDRGFLNVRRPGSDGRVPLDDIEAVLASAQGLTYTNAALAALAERCAPLVICGRDYSPVAVLMPLQGHFQQGQRMAAQAGAARPRLKRLWANIVAAKITAQSLALQRVNVRSERLSRLAINVRSGDPDNCEAQAAQVYWPLLMGGDFRRDRAAGGVNSLLNYGYAVLRAATARAIVGAGLHPSLALHHESQGDPLRLADDLMEPFRPAVDIVARHLMDRKAIAVDAHTKAALAGILYHDYRTSTGRTPLSLCLSRLAGSLAQVFLKEATKLDLPLILCPLPDSAAEPE